MMKIFQNVFGKKGTKTRIKAGGETIEQLQYPDCNDPKKIEDSQRSLAKSRKYNAVKFERKFKK